MARRRVKKRTHIGASNGPAGKVTNSKSINAPKSMVIRIGAGEVGPSVSQLVKDVRRMMAPDTAARLKERRSNRSESGNTHLRLAITPRGPTLHFQIENYSLCKDVRKAQRHPKGSAKEYITAPLLVMNNFVSPSTETDPKNKVPKHLESLVTTIFQSLFPPISPQTTPLSSIKRVLLLDREPSKSNDGTYTLSLRHYAITTKTTGLSKPLRRLNAAEKLINSQKTGNVRKGGLPNLGKMSDIAEFMIGGDGDGYTTDGTSGSEIETDAEVEVFDARVKKVSSKRHKERNNKDEKSYVKSNKAEKRAVKLVELGPRMRLRMTKVEEGVCNGKIMWHEYIQKTKEEAKALDQKWEQRRQEKEVRKKIQRENVDRKKKAKEASAKSDKDGDEDEMDLDEWDSDEFVAENGEIESDEEMKENDDEPNRERFFATG